MSKTTEELAKEAGMEECPDGCWATSGALASVYTESLKRFRQLCIAEERARLLDVARGPVGHFVYTGYSPTNEQHFVKVLFPSEADAKAFKAALEKQ